MPRGAKRVNSLGLDEQGMLASPSARLTLREFAQREVSPFFDRFDTFFSEMQLSGFGMEGANYRVWKQGEAERTGSTIAAKRNA